MAVATTVDSMAPMKIASITPNSARRLWLSSISLVTAGAAGAAAPRAQVGVRIEALVTIGPGHPQPTLRLLDGLRPERRRRWRLQGDTRAARTCPTERLEGVDAPVLIGPGDAQGIPADEVHVERSPGVGLADDRQELLPVHVAFLVARRSWRSP